MQTARGQADQFAARGDSRPEQQAVPFSGSDDEARKIVLALRVKARHLGGLATDQGHAILLAREANPAYHLGSDLRVEPTDGKIVQEEQRGGTLDGDVVDAMVDQALAHAIVAVCGERNLELRPDSVGGADEDGIRQARPSKGVHSPERTYAGEHVAVERPTGEIPDTIRGGDGRIDIDTGVGVSQGLLRHRKIPIIAVAGGLEWAVPHARESPV